MKTKDFMSQKAGDMTIEELVEDPVIFAKYYLGVTLRLHQSYIIDRLLKSNPKTKKLGKRAKQRGKKSHILGNEILCFEVDSLGGDRRMALSRGGYRIKKSLERD